MGGIEIPASVKARTLLNPHELFWQFHFRESETKSKERVRAILPYQLVPLLEEYLDDHRLILLGDRDPGNVFVTSRGNPLGSDDITGLVGKITLKYAQKRVTPHAFRHIFAYKWLRDHPTDYLTLSKHSGTKT